MDILFRLRLVLWMTVLALWGSIVYQYLGEEVEQSQRMQWVANPFPKTRRGLASSPPVRIPAPWEAEKLPSRTAPQAPPLVKPVVPHLPGTKPPRAVEKVTPPDTTPEQAPPTGFVKNETRHFIVFSENTEATPAFLKSVEALHGNIMLDLSAFSPWARDQKVSIFLFRSQLSYRRVTGRPAWSGGASSVSRRKIYLYESDEVFGILAHELCHIYFDSFFSGGQTNPLWLSEGMATLVQIERGLTSPNWLPENLNVLYRGGGYPLEDLMKVEGTSGASDDNVRLWYTQAYSVVRFLIRSKWKSSFYKFCQQLRSGKPMSESLFRAYGMPFNRVKALEFAWRYDLETHRLTQLRGSSN